MKGKVYPGAKDTLNFCFISSNDTPHHNHTYTRTCTFEHTYTSIHTHRHVLRARVCVCGCRFSKILTTTSMYLKTIKTPRRHAWSSAPVTLQKGILSSTMETAVWRPGYLAVGVWRRVVCVLEASLVRYTSWKQYMEYPTSPEGMKTPPWKLETVTFLLTNQEESRPQLYTHTKTRVHTIKESSIEQTLKTPTPLGGEDVMMVPEITKIVDHIPEQQKTSAFKEGGKVWWQRQDLNSS